MSEKRISDMEKVLTNLVREDKGTFVIFENPPSEKFVQFAILEEEMICDIPLQELSNEEENRITSFMEIGATDARTGEPISYQKSFGKNATGKAAEFAETLFLEVFRLPKSYTMETKIGN